MDEAIAQILSEEVATPMTLLDSFIYQYQEVIISIGAFLLILAVLKLALLIFHGVSVFLKRHVP